MLEDQVSVTQGLHLPKHFARISLALKLHTLGSLNNPTTTPVYTEL